MSIKSYVVHPKPGRKSQLMYQLSKLNSCEVVASENKDILILVTDTENKVEDEQLLAQINELDQLSMLSMVSGFNTTPNQ
jgi:nitrate reductase NapAB chaperone NapD